ncbi:MAG: 4Fe-4S dicluster domain-containing protein [Candidatus Heimdallarchaeota archaeon]|nr:4Fe-4S dicluster domain-containing protein [Candidatus Heimdallarchaeota archaeon]
MEENEMTEAKTKDEEEFEVETWTSEPEEGTAGETGLWRTFRPVIDHDECIRCEICSLYCPEPCITLDESDPSHKKGKMVIDYEYCKGCGICANECPKHCIEMVKETTIDEEKEKEEK